MPNNRTQILIVAQRTITKWLKKPFFWQAMLLPIVIIIVGMLVTQGSSKGSLSHQDIITLTNGMLAFYLLIMSYMYCNISAVEISEEKTSKLMELILSFSSTKAQLFGKITGVIGLLLINTGIYLVSFKLIFIFTPKLLVFQKVVQELSAPKVMFLVVDILGAMLWLIEAGTEVGMYVSQKKQVQGSIFPFVLAIGMAISLALMPMSAWSEAGMGWFYKVCLLSPLVGPICLPTSLVDGEIDYVFAWIALMINLLEAVFLIVWMLPKQYKIAYLSKKTSSPYMQAFNNELKIIAHDTTE
ncbi:hypothetical protein EQG49_06725 [Periweissella cryptocerci]|uniref:ABC transporter permease n=1 Tax=Periweissella cryptocerci TaxID=2506420 RepID=A0A4V1AIP0_9LACO|nr:ABC transporter permease [Periweissella cryptocerci]QBO36175.1 hypothetical protein EQG49_06725 [Periweissella cryptocerci]